MMNKKNLLHFIETIAFLGIMGFFFILPLEGHAETTVFSKALDTLYTTFANVRVIVYATAGFGLIGVALAAIAGKFPWQWLAMISVALFTLAAAEKIVMYVTGVGDSSSAESDFNSEVGDSEFKIQVRNGSDFNINDFNQNKTDNDFKNFLQNGK